MNTLKCPACGTARSLTTQKDGSKHAMCGCRGSKGPFAVVLPAASKSEKPAEKKFLAESQKESKDD